MTVHEHRREGAVCNLSAHHVCHPRVDLEFRHARCPDLPAYRWRARPGRLGHAGGAAGVHPAHHLLGHLVPAPQPGPSRGRFPSGGRACLPLLAVADHLDDHPRVGGHPPQAPRKGGNRGRPAQPGHPRHRQGVLARCGAVPRSPRHACGHRTVRPRHARRCHRAPPLHPARHPRPGAAAGHQQRAVRPARRGPVGDPDGLDSVLGGGRGQRPEPLVGLPQLRVGRHLHQPDAVGVLDRWRGTAQQPPCFPQFGALCDAPLGVRHRLERDPPAAGAAPGQGAAGGAGHGRAPEHRRARCRDPEGAAVAPLPGNDRLPAQRVHAGPARRSHTGRGQAAPPAAAPPAPGPGQRWPLAAAGQPRAAQRMGRAAPAHPYPGRVPRAPGRAAGSPRP